MKSQIRSVSLSSKTTAIGVLLNFFIYKYLCIAVNAGEPCVTLAVQSMVTVVSVSDTTTFSFSKIIENIGQSNLQSTRLL